MKPIKKLNEFVSLDAAEKLLVSNLHLNEIGMEYGGMDNHIEKIINSAFHYCTIDFEKMEDVKLVSNTTFHKSVIHANNDSMVFDNCKFIDCIIQTLDKECNYNKCYFIKNSMLIENAALNTCVIQDCSLVGITSKSLEASIIKCVGISIEKPTNNHVKIIYSTAANNSINAVVEYKDGKDTKKLI